MKIIDEQLLNGLAEEAKKSPRLRMNYNFHQSLQDKCHRFLNALEPGTFIPMHHHSDKAETERAVRLQLISSVATHYYALVMMDEQLRVTHQSMNNALQTVEVMEALKEVGMQNEAAVSQARAAYLNTAASEKSLLQQIKNTENALMVLISEKHDSICRTAWENTDVCIADTTAYAIETLATRPDVKAAEYALKAQMEQVNVARAAFYPQLTISASVGWTNNVGEIVNPGQILLNAIGSLVQPLFNKGKNRANLRIAKAGQEQALVAFNQSLLVAGGETKRRTLGLSAEPRATGATPAGSDRGRACL